MTVCLSSLFSFIFCFLRGFIGDGTSSWAMLKSQLSRARGGSNSCILSFELRKVLWSSKRGSLGNFVLGWVPLNYEYSTVLDGMPRCDTSISSLPPPHDFLRP